MKVVEKIEKKQVAEFYRQMLLIRRFEEKAAEMYMRGKIRGFLHLYIGEEAIAVGAISVLKPEDYIVTHYRDHGHAIARGMDPKVIMAELFGKATGSSKGKGGSMHLFDASKNFLGGYAIVGAQLPIAVGLALASRQLQNGRVVLCFFGEGAVNEGEFHESMNLASLWKLPIVFFLENNLYGMGTHIDNTHAGGRDVYKAVGDYNMASHRVDGMDVMAVHEATLEAVDGVRSGEGPFFLEALTYRFRGHSMADPINYRDKAEEAEWRRKDPIDSLKRWALEEGVLTKNYVETIEEGVEKELQAAVEFADQSPDPPLDSLMQDVYA
ncbi:MAG: pyruvate dehydrogenase (acetyl-transferring) E1 component subunit alpha [Chloroflexi bacterium]|nr:pyruvate dehydrogenase (acetyl-transferring) E1 component subunit alpha [Chloroflexota bacterium]